MTDTSKALELADALEAIAGTADNGRKPAPDDRRRWAAAELRRQHADIVELKAELERIRALEPVAVIGPAYQMLWTRQCPLEGLKVGDPLYTMPAKKDQP